MGLDGMYSGTIFYTREFADYEKGYLEHSFRSCFDVGCCTGQAAELGLKV